MSQSLNEINTTAAIVRWSTLSRSTVARAIRAGKLRTTRMGRRVVIHKADALAWLGAPKVVGVAE